MVHAFLVGIVDWLMFTMFGDDAVVMQWWRSVAVNGISLLDYALE